MFRKQPISIGPSTSIRSSDRRRLLASLSAQYPSLSTDTLKSLVPDGIRCGNVRTSGEVEGVIYSDPVSGDPLWVGMKNSDGTGRKEGEKRFWPTLYTIAKYMESDPKPEGQLLPMLPIHQPPPAQWLSGGAPLFVPAVKFLSHPYRLPALSTSTTHNDPLFYPTSFVLFVTPTPASSPSSSIKPEHYQILGIGQFTSSHNTFSAHLDAWTRSKEVVEKGKHSLGDGDVGRLCDTLAMVGDSLWEMGSKRSLPTVSYVEPDLPMKPSPASGLPSITTGSSSSTSLHDSPSPQVVHDLKLPDTQQDPPDSHPSTQPLLPSQIDAFLTLALHQSLISLGPDSLPIQSSSLYSAHILPSRPASIPKEQREEVVIAKSSWRKLGKWMKVCGDGKGGSGLLRVKEQKDGSHLILGIDQNHELLQSHAPHFSIAQEYAREIKQAGTGAAGPLQVTANGSPAPLTAGGTASGSAASSGAGRGEARELQVEQLWRPSSAGGAFWEAAGYNKETYLTHRQILDAFNKYVVDHTLNSMQDRASILLDETLGKACSAYKKPKFGDAEEQLSVRKDQVVEGLKGEMSAVLRIGGEGGTIKKGVLEPIMLTTKKRGKKTVTVIHNMETFGINPNDLAEELRKVCAGSAAVDSLAGAPPAANKKEVMVQGSQHKAVTAVLMGRGVPRKWIKEVGDGKGK